METKMCTCLELIKLFEKFQKSNQVEDQQDKYDEYLETVKEYIKDTLIIIYNKRNNRINSSWSDVKNTILNYKELEDIISKLFWEKPKISQNLIIDNIDNKEYHQIYKLEQVQSEDLMMREQSIWKITINTENVDIFVK